MNSKMRILTLLIITIYFSAAKPAFCQTADETLTLLNTLFTRHALGATNFSFKKISDNEIIATNSVTVNNFGAEKLTYRFNPKNAVSVSTTASKNSVTIKFSFRESTVIWFDKHMEVERLSKIQCSLANITPEETEEIMNTYKYLIKSLGGSIKDEIF